jgi:hypothetical protein
MGLPNSKEFREVFYLKRKKLESHLDVRRDLLSVSGKQMQELFGSVEKQMHELRAIDPDNKRSRLDSRFTSIKETLNKFDEAFDSVKQLQIEILFFQVMLEEEGYWRGKKRMVTEILSPRPKGERVYPLTKTLPEMRRDIEKDLEIWIEQFGQNSPPKSEDDERKSSDLIV